MNRPPSLLELCESWRHLCEVEGEAILAADWAKVAEAQAGKQSLQPHLEAAREGDTGSAVRAVAAGLIALERRNRERLRAQQQAAQAARAELERTSQNLRRLHQAYAPGATPVWNSFS